MQKPNDANTSPGSLLLLSGRNAPYDQSDGADFRKERRGDRRFSEG
jgi:hypothetical protein